MTRQAETRTEGHRRRSSEQAARRLADVAEIGDLPPIADKARRRRATRSFKTFCEVYFPEMFYLQWSSAHLETIKAIEETVVKGALQCLALPRGSGKTSLCQAAIVWALLTGRRRFGVLVAANQARANQLLADIKTWFETNDLLLADWPEVMYPIRQLEGISQRQRSQTYHGVKTAIDWKTGVLVFPTIAKSKSSGARLAALGLTSSGLRGLSASTRDGDKIRPDLVLADDPQDAESAASLEQTNQRERIIKADLLGLAGPGRKVALLVTITVMCEDDLAARLLDHVKNPEFRGRKYSLINKLPDNMDLWRQYADRRAIDLERGGDGAAATQFYKDNRAAMDAGCVANWPARFNDDEISAVQNAMNLYFRDEASFRTEYQNEPAETIAAASVIEPATVAAAVNGQPRGYIPSEASFLTGFIDVHKKVLYWAVCAWSRDFNGVVVDYGTWPRQNKEVFVAADAFPDLFMSGNTNSVESAVYKGLEDLTHRLFTVDFMRADGTTIELERVGVDNGWGQTRQTVLRAIHESPYRARLYPSHGRYYSATSRQMDEYNITATTRRGDHWVYYRDPRKAPGGQLLFDTNHWKTRLYNALRSTAGDPGRLRIDGAPAEHTLLTRHLGAEYAIQDEANGIKKDVWRARGKGWTDNHWLDCLTSCMVAASFNGARFIDAPAEPPKRRRRSFADIQRAAQGANL